jgi:hypothetical protein
LVVWVADYHHSKTMCRKTMDPISIFPFQFLGLKCVEDPESMSQFFDFSFQFWVVKVVIFSMLQTGFVSMKLNSPWQYKSGYWL